MQKYGIVTPGNSSVMLTLFRTAFLKFYFRPNRLNDALFVIFFAIKKNMARVTNCLASTIQLNFGSLFHSLSWRAAILRRQAADELLGISWAASFSAGTISIEVVRFCRTQAGCHFRLRFKHSSARRHGDLLRPQRLPAHRGRFHWLFCGPGGLVRPQGRGSARRWAVAYSSERAAYPLLAPERAQRVSPAPGSGLSGSPAPALRR